MEIFTQIYFRFLSRVEHVEKMKTKKTLTFCHKPRPRSRLFLSSFPALKTMRTGSSKKLNMTQRTEKVQHH